MPRKSKARANLRRLVKSGGRKKALKRVRNLRKSKTDKR